MWMWLARSASVHSKKQIAARNIRNHKPQDVRASRSRGKDLPEIKLLLKMHLQDVIARVVRHNKVVNKPDSHKDHASNLRDLVNRDRAVSLNKDHNRHNHPAHREHLVKLQMNNVRNNKAEGNRARSKDSRVISQKDKLHRADPNNKVSLPLKTLREGNKTQEEIITVRQDNADNKEETAPQDQLRMLRKILIKRIHRYKNPRLIKRGFFLTTIFNSIFHRFVLKLFK